MSKKPAPRRKSVKQIVNLGLRDAGKPRPSDLAIQANIIEGLALEVEEAIRSTVKSLRASLLPNPFEELGQ